MKRYILIFLTFSIGAAAYMSFPLSREEHFVSIKDKNFYLDGKEFYPLALNYILSLQTDKTNLWFAPYAGYVASNNYKHQYVTKDSSLLALKADMDLIKEMGFNAVRLVGMDILVDEKTGVLSCFANCNNEEKDTPFMLTNDKELEPYFTALNDMLEVVKKAGLKAIVLNKVLPDTRSSEYYLMKVAERLKDQSALMAYDFYNEPLYFDKPERDKKDVYETVKRWGEIIKMYAPHQLSTIGLEGIREVFEWDPNILNVDFISMHPYEYEPEQVRNEIYWYGKHVEKPWIIGETAIPADNDSVSYTEQAEFARKTLKQALNCGSSGYSWWQYKDVDWQVFHASYMGVVNMKGITRTKAPNLPITGTQKPLVEEFKKFDPMAPKGDCEFLPNYYNYSQHKDCRIKGKLVDENGAPINGGVILAWNQWWDHSYHTITKEDGTFEVLGNFKFYHWMVSATKYSMVRGDILPDTAKKEGSIPTLNLGEIKLQKLSFID